MKREAFINKQQYLNKFDSENRCLKKKQLQWGMIDIQLTELFKACSLKHFVYETAM